MVVKSVVYDVYPPFNARRQNDYHKLMAPLDKASAFPAMECGRIRLG